MNNQLINDVYELLSDWDYYVSHDLHSVYDLAHTHYSIVLDISKMQKNVQKTVNELKRDFFLYQNMSTKQNQRRLTSKYTQVNQLVLDFKHNVTLGLLSL